MPSTPRSWKSAGAIHPRVFRSSRSSCFESLRTRWAAQRIGLESPPGHAGTDRLRAQVDFPACGGAAATRYARSGVGSRSSCRRRATRFGGPRNPDTYGRTHKGPPRGGPDSCWSGWSRTLHEVRL